MFKTSRPIDYPASRIYPAFTLPQGTKVRLIKGADGVKGDGFAVDSVALLVDLTGNAHDPKYRYVFVSRSDVESDDGAPVPPAFDL